jgi:hypothetical protein
MRTEDSERQDPTVAIKHVPADRICISVQGDHIQIEIAK